MTTPSSNINNSTKKDDLSYELWTTAAIKDELTFRLSSTCSLKIDENGQVYIARKYHDRADFVLHRISVYDPPPTFVINRSDITPKLQIHLERLYK